NPVPNDTDTHTVEVHLYLTDNSQTGVYIQPNRATYTDDYVLDLWDLQLEKGNKATDWTPAPEDTLTQDEYKTFKSDYKTTVEGITGQITSLETSKLDGNTYTNFLSNEYKTTAEKATSAFTKVNKVVDAS